jgi:hypothetical protein
MRAGIHRLLLGTISRSMRALAVTDRAAAQSSSSRRGWTVIPFPYSGSGRLCTGIARPSAGRVWRLASKVAGCISTPGGYADSKGSTLITHIIPSSIFSNTFGIRTIAGYHNVSSSLPPTI